MPNDYEYGRRLSESYIAEVFENEFPAVTGRAVQMLSEVESPDRVALIDGKETGIEFTAIHAGRKHASYQPRGIFRSRPIILLGHLDWPARDVEGPALYDVYEELGDSFDTSDFARFGFAEIWLMDDGFKYTSRKDPRAPADFFCFAPENRIGFWERERKRRPYWPLLTEMF